VLKSSLAKILIIVLFLKIILIINFLFLSFFLLLFDLPPDPCSAPADPSCHGTPVENGWSWEWPMLLCLYIIICLPTHFKPRRWRQNSPPKRTTVLRVTSLTRVILVVSCLKSNWVCPRRMHYEPVKVHDDCLCPIKHAVLVQQTHGPTYTHAGWYHSTWFSSSRQPL
jgi:hypothetical protein